MRFLFFGVIVVGLLGVGWYLFTTAIPPETTRVQNSTNQAEDLNVLTFQVAPEEVDCVGVGPRKCLVVNDEYFYDSIAGFTFEPGFRYELLVARTESEKVPADASRYTYELVETVSKTPVSAEPTTNLAGTSWQWQETRYTSGEIITPKQPEAFTLTFTGDGRFSATTDCNTASGSYSLEDRALSFAQIATTKKACLSDTQEAAFIDMLKNVEAFVVSETGVLGLTFADDAGSIVFTPLAE